MAQRRDREAFANEYVNSLCSVLRDLPLSSLADALAMLEQAHAERRQVFLAGNGGSAATASHMANDLMKGVAKACAGGLRAMSLSDSIPLITAIANDDGYDDIFSGQLVDLADPDDLLILISGSGNSPNVVRAAAVARDIGMSSIAFLGMKGGELAAMVDVAVVVPSDDYGFIEDVHMVFDHLVTAYLREKLGERSRHGD